MDQRDAAPPRAFTICRVGGIPISIHASWIVSLAVLSTFARIWVFRDEEVEWRAWAFGVAVGVALAGCVVLHELAHAVVARAYGLPVARILLFAFGGISQIRGEAPTPAAEYRVALAGPLASLVIGSTLLGVARWAHAADGIHEGWLNAAYFNVWVALFNLVPAFPMDGGRILRSALWAGMRSRARATRWAVATGRLFAAALIGGGVTLLVLASAGLRDAPSGIWAMLIGWFLFNASGAAGRAEGGELPTAPPRAELPEEAWR